MAPASVGLELRRPKPYGSRLTSTCGHGGRLGAIAVLMMISKALSDTERSETVRTLGGVMEGA
jgi:hypothetical protein